MTAWTRKACPLCKKGDFRRAPDEVCEDCKKRIDELERFQKETMKARGKTSPYMICAYPYFSAGNFVSTDKLRDAFRDLILSFAAPSKDSERYHQTPDGYNSKPMIPKNKIQDSGYAADVSRDLTKEQAEAVQALYEAIIAFGKDSHASGYEDGNNLIVRLAAGKVSLKKFDKEVSKETKTKRYDD